MAPVNVFISGGPGRGRIHYKTANSKEELKSLLAPYKSSIGIYYSSVPKDVSIQYVAAPDGNPSSSSLKTLSTRKGPKKVITYEALYALIRRHTGKRGGGRSKNQDWENDAADNSDVDYSDSSESNDDDEDDLSDDDRLGGTNNSRKNDLPQTKPKPKKSTKSKLAGTSKSKSKSKPKPKPEPKSKKVKAKSLAKPKPKHGGKSLVRSIFE